ncbi:MAG: hypothetical protein K0S32_2087 [Bacteroidetes bacterium]|nr:hypothetical protein [Bacteroidota bacterium]
MLKDIICLFIILKKCLIILFLIAISVWSCDEEPMSFEQVIKLDTIPPMMSITGNKIDTAYLYSDYNDQGVALNDWRHGGLKCLESSFVKTEGEVNVNIPGTYTITYRATDLAGNSAVPVTRTVHVVPSPLASFHGVYKVACTCTAEIAGSKTTTITNENYLSDIKPAGSKNHFDIVSMNIGRERLTVSSAIVGDKLESSAFNVDYHYLSGGTGTISLAKNTFTIESIYYLYSPRIDYRCRNVFGKQLVEISAK